MKRIVLVDPNGRVNWSAPDVVARHDAYAKMLYAKSSKKLNLVVLTQKTSRTSIPVHRIEIENLFQGKLSFARNIYNLFCWASSTTITPVLLIASDPWNSFLHAKILSFAFKLHGHRVNIQTQIHFEPRSIMSKNQIKNILRFILLKIALASSTSIRCVSTSQALQITELNESFASKIFVAPVPLNIESNSELSFCSNRPKAIGFLGRIHPERGLAKYLEIAREISHADKGVNFIIAGDGPNRDVFLTELRDFAGIENVIYLGEVTQNLEEIFWSRIGVLLSTAEFESYGRSIREALYYGIPVTAVESAGTSDLAKLGIDYLSVLSSNKQSEVFAADVLKSLNLISDTRYKDIVHEETRTSLNALIESWMTNSYLD